MVYVGSFAVGLGPVFWLLLSEIYPLRIRGRAMSVGTVANWGANLIVAVTCLTLTQVLGKPMTFWLYGVISIGVWIFAFSSLLRRRGTASDRSRPTGRRERSHSHYRSMAKRVRRPPSR